MNHYLNIRIHCLALSISTVQNAPSDWSGASEGLALMAMTTANGSTALEVAQRWGNNAFTKLLITKKREFDMQMRVHEYAIEHTCVLDTRPISRIFLCFSCIWTMF